MQVGNFLIDKEKHPRNWTRIQNDEPWKFEISGFKMAILKIYVVEFWGRYPPWN